MEWKPLSQEISGRLAAAIVAFDCEKRKMFGCPCYFVHNNMFAGVQGDTLFIRLSEDDRKALFRSNPDASPFIPMGRPMKEYVVLPAGIVNDQQELIDWLNRSYGFAASLPPKELKKKKL
jgi:TfoX/Sxy family transcriptional regulator of competence genes